MNLRADGFTTEEENDAKEPYMWRLGRSSCLRPAEFVPVTVLRDGTGVFQSGNHVRPFFLRQEARRFGGARKEEK